MTNSRKYKTKIEYLRIFNKSSSVQRKLNSLYTPLVNQTNFIIRSMPLNNNEWGIESRKKHSLEIQKNAHYYYYILCRRQVQLSSHTELNKKNLLISGEIKQKASHSFKNSIEKNLSLPQTTKPVTSLMWTLLNKRKNSNQSISSEEQKISPFSTKTARFLPETKFPGQMLNKQFIKEKKTKSPNLRLDAKMETGTININRNTTSFFPYKKSFLCYWLLPFVGFVSSATLSFNPQSTEEKSVSLFDNSPESNSYSNEKNQFNDSVNVFLSQMPLVKKDKNSNLAVFYENGEISPGNFVSGRNRNANLTDSFFFDNRKKNLTKSFNTSDLVTSNLLDSKSFKKKETSLIPSLRKSTYSEKDESLPTSDYFVKRPRSFVSSSSLNIGTGLHFKLNKQSISNRYKYCLHYLECLENTLSKPEQKKDSLFSSDFNIIKKKNLSLPYESVTKIRLDSPNAFSKNSLFYRDLKTEQLKFNTGFYLTSFFNRLLFSKSLFATNSWNGKFDNSLEGINQIKPLKINLNVPVSYLYDSNSEAKAEFKNKTLLQAPFSNVAVCVENGDISPGNKVSGRNLKNSKVYSSLLNIISEQMFFPVAETKFPRDPSFSMKKRTGLKFSQEGFKNSQETRFNSLNQERLTYLDTYFNKTNPVTSFIRASTLLDKYMIYKPIFSQVKTEKQPPFSMKGPAETSFPRQVLNSHINSFLINKLFSYYSNQLFDDKYLESSKVLNLTKKKTTNDSFSAFEPVFGTTTQADSLYILLKKIASFDDNKSKDLWDFASEKKSSLKRKRTETKFPKPLGSNLSGIDSSLSGLTFTNVSGTKELKNQLNSGENDSFLNLEKKKVLYQLSKETLYKFILIDLANNIKDIASPLDSSFNNISKLMEGTYNETSSLVQFKHPLLMSNHIAYPEKVIPANKKEKNTLFDSNQLNSLEKDSYKKNLIEPKKDLNINNTSLKKIIQSNIEQQPLIYQNQNDSCWGSNKNKFVNKNLEFPFVPETSFLEQKSTFSSKNTSVIQKPFLPQMSFAEQIRHYLNKYTLYALKDFFILNKINTHLKSLNTEPYMKNALFQMKTDYSAKKTAPVFLENGGSRGNFVSATENGDISPGNFVSGTNAFPGQKKTKLFVLNIPRIIDKKTQKTIQYEKKKSLNQPDKKVFLTHKFPFKFSKKYQSDKKAKLLRTYFSIKKTTNLKQRLSSQSTSFQVLTATKRMNSILDSSSKLKEKMTINLMSKSLLQKQHFETNNLTTNTLINDLAEKQISSLKFPSKKMFFSSMSNKRKKPKILLNQFNLPIQKKMKEVETRIISPRLLVNNRLFMNINFVKEASDDLHIKNMNEPNEEILRKRKSIQKKRRITKLKKETRRRKKRMRFYPRPLWLRYRCYSQFLKDRRHSKSLFPFNNFIQDEAKKSLERNLFESHHFSMRSVFPYHAGNVSVDISSSVMGELKTAFWKSYWLRSNLKPYLNRIKTSLKDMKESSPQPSQASSFFQVGNNQTGKAESSRSTVFSKKKMNSYYKTAHYLAEYNQISEQRIRQFVSQIRENLTLNGNDKVRPSRIIVQFTPYKKTSRMKGIHFLKRPTLRYDALSRLRLYWALSKGNSNLVISGASGYPPSTDNLNSHFYNKRKQLWTTEKFRQQTKENKTKKLSNNLKTKIQSFLNDTPYFMLQDGGSLTEAMLLKSLRKIRIQNEKLYSLSFVHNKENKSLGLLATNKNSFSRSRNENYDSNQFKIRHSRLKNSSIGTAKAYPFISGKTSYWWLQFKPTTINGLGSSISNSINNGSSIQNLFGQNSFSSISNKNIQKNLVSSNNNSYINSSTIHKQSNESLLQINTLLFHFCSLITLLSISQIRGLVKFTFIGLNKIFTLFERLTPSFLYKPFFTTDAYSNKSLNLNTKTPFGPKVLSNKNKFVSQMFAPKMSGASLKASSINATESNFKKQNPVDSRINKQFLNILDPFFVAGNNSLKKQNVAVFVENGDIAPGNKVSGTNVGKNRSYMDRLLQDRVFDLNKRNDSFLYFFYATPLEKNLVSSSISLPQNNLIESFLKTPLKQSFSEQFSKTIEEEQLTKGSRQLISAFNLRFLLMEKPFGLTEKLQNKSMRFNMASSLIGFYSLLNFSVKKPLVFLNKWFLKLTAQELRKKSVSITPKSIFNSVDENKEMLTKVPLTEMNNNDKLIPLFNSKIVLYSLFGLKQILGYSIQVSQNFSTLLGQRAKLENGFRSIYMFFEKPGVLIVDWVAYLFLVEWASDITNTLPENVDTQILGSPFNKLTRTIYSVSPLLPGSQFIFQSTVFRSLTNYGMNITNGIWSSGFASQITLLNLSSTFLKRRMYHLYEILVLQFYQPDTDLLVRQRKGIVFWDIWGDFLTQTAEDSNINISELTSLKEEQMKLLENASLEIAEESNLQKIRPTINLTSSKKKSSLTKKEQTKKLSPKVALIESQKGSIEEKLSFQKKIIYSRKTSLSSIKRFKDQIYSQKIGGGLKKTVFNVSSFKPTAEIKSLSPSFLGIPLQSRSQKQENRLHQWGSQQFLSYAIKSKDTELFIDLHPPRALSNLLKNKDSSQQLRSISPLGSLVCQILSGILTKQISKNILIIGNSSQKSRKKENSTSGNDSALSLEKTLLVQAIAGETELKMITDNAYRYALVYRGVAVGIKLLRDVFDSLSLQTPCFFLIEDIHAIGERRPFLISDDTPEGEQNVEVHEKNQVLYQLSKHVISHYKKPYKGDFSLSIPTNHFCFDFFKGRTSASSQIGKASLSRQKTISPKIPYTEISNGEQKQKGITKVLKSRLNRSSVELLSPPVTSPFSVLTLKEDKKFKTKKKVSDLSWTGKTSVISQADNMSSQDSQKTGPAHSIRSKVALLADVAISSLSVKLDMITDLLVIIDSVKGNRGFVVFATTHIPFVLDPALRRPGRLDETIHFGFSSKNHAWEISRLGILNIPSSRAFESSHSSAFIDQTAIGKKGGGSLDFSLSSIDIDTHTLLARLSKSALKIYSSQNTLTYSKRTSSLFSSFSNHLFKPNLIQNSTQSFNNQNNLNSSFPKNSTSRQSLVPLKLQDSSKTFVPETKFPGEISPFSTKTATFANKTLIREELMNYSSLNYPKTSQILSQVATKASSYFNVSLHFFAPQIPLIDQKSPIQLKSKKELSSQHNNIETSHFDLCINNELTQSSDFSTQNTFVNSSHLSLYGSPHLFKKNISFLISSKIGEFLLFSKNSRLEPIISSDINLMKNDSLEVLNPPSKHMLKNWSQKHNSTRIKRRISLMPILNESISSLILSFVQKRFLYKKNLLLPSLFNLTNYSSLLEPHSPPISSILLPAKRYENLKRSLFYYQNNDQNVGGGMIEKRNIHQQQRLVKRLYHVPVKESFRSEMIENRLSGFSNASLMIGNISPSRLQKTSVSNWFVRNRILTRHSNYLTNQWWTGQLPEHNSETTFLSDIDWRYTFVAGGTFGEKEARDILLDFPDADQHYNPRNRRWVGNLESGGVLGTIGINSLTSSISKHGSSVETNSTQDSLVSTQTTTENSIYTEIYTHFIYDSFIKAFNIYEQNREVFDYYVFYICKQGLHSNLNEFERLKLIERFLNF